MDRAGADGAMAKSQAGGVRNPKRGNRLTFARARRDASDTYYYKEALLGSTCYSAILVRLWINVTNKQFTWDGANLRPTPFR